jgi:hypothetical protein
MTEPKPAGRTRKTPIFAQAYEFPEGGNPLEVFLSSFTDESARTTRAALESVADILSDGKVAAPKLAWHRLRANHVAALRGRMLRYYAPATSNRYLGAIRGVLKEAWRLELVDREVMERTMDVAPVRGRREQRGRAVTRDELGDSTGSGVGCGRQGVHRLSWRDLAKRTFDVDVMLCPSCGHSPMLVLGQVSSGAAGAVEALKSGEGCSTSKTLGRAPARGRSFRARGPPRSSGQLSFRFA